MPGMNVRQRLRVATDTVLDWITKHQTEWWFMGALPMPNSLKPEGWPNVWDINHGYCSAWARCAAYVLGLDDDAILDVVMEDSIVPGTGHVVLQHDGRYFDAQCLGGVPEIDMLPYMREIPRTAYMRERAKERTDAG